MGKRARRKFTPEYKAEVVKMVKDGGESIGDAVKGSEGGGLGDKGLGRASEG